jgi:hypothetical protein
LPHIERIFRHPGRQPLLTLIKCQPASASDTPEFDAQFSCEQTTEREPERRALSVAAVVVPDAVPERLGTRPTIVKSWRLWSDPNVEKRKVPNHDATIGRDSGDGLEEPPIDPR